MKKVFVFILSILFVSVVYCEEIPYEYTEWFDYEHRVLGYVEDKLVPIPFNLKSIELCFEKEKANRLKEILINIINPKKAVSKLLPNNLLVILLFKNTIHKIAENNPVTII